MKRMTATAMVAMWALTAAIDVAAAGQARDPHDDVWRRMAQALPAGSTVAVRPVTGHRVTGVLVDVDDSAITVKPKTRVPEPAVRFSYDSLDDLQLREARRVSFGKYAAIGGAVGAALFFWLLTVGG